MAAVLRLDHDVELGALDRGVVEQALVMDLDDVAAVLADDAGEARQRARACRAIPSAAAPGSPSRTSPRIRIEASSRASILPPEMTMPTRLPRNRSGVASSAASPAAPAPSTTSFSPSSRCSIARFDQRVVDQQDVVDQRRDDAPGQPARLLDRDALGERRAGGGRSGILAAQQSVHRRVERRLHADDLDLPGFSALAATAMPEISPPPPIGTISVSRSGWSASISSAIVPWPAITAGSS